MQCFEQPDVGVVMVDACHRFVFVNDFFCQLVGYDREQLLGTPFERLTHPGDAALNSQLIDRMMSGEVERYTMHKRYVHRDGHAVPSDANAWVIRDSFKRVLYVIGTAEPTETLKPLEVKIPVPLTSEEQELDRIRRAVLEW